MPKLQEYVAPSRELNPENRGYQAFETAGRRVGGLFREAGTSMIAEAKAKAQALADKAQWPFTLFELKQRFETPAKTTASTGTGGIGGFSVRRSRTSGTDEQFASRVMPDLYGANLSNSYNEFYNPVSGRLSPEGAHRETLANEAARLTNQLRSLIGDTGPFSTMPQGPGPNADAEASAQAWGQTIAGSPVPTGYTPSGDYDTEYGGGGDSWSVAPAPSIPSDAPGLVGL